MHDSLRFLSVECIPGADDLCGRCAMFLGQYDFDGDPAQLLPAYDRLMTNIPDASVFFHACIRRENGITIIDACPSASDFAATAADADLRELMRGAGLPTPTVTPLGEVHAARADSTYLSA